MTQDPHQSGASDPYGASQPSRPDATGGQLPDYRPAATGGPGQVPPGSMPPGQMPGPGQYGNPTPTNTSAVVLSVISGVLTLSGICCLVGLIPLIFGILGLTQNASDPEHAKKMTRIGWITLVLLSLVVLVAIIGVVLFATMGGPSTDGYTSL
ncbi:hypothetical protein [Janibacter cremeus]|uniref:DUF4190 domain-containing protein n=1 Tax=Janibacter cremeus TaxID=1285192 RepID=A0A852VL95_9MICO|nr:hypothetical protein [Janibacter cremeus]NYF97847.1 hypothetical protein [Janibacter cremeus]